MDTDKNKELTTENTEDTELTEKTNKTTNEHEYTRKLILELVSISVNSWLKFPSVVSVISVVNVSFI